MHPSYLEVRKQVAEETFCKDNITRPKTITLIMFLKDGYMAWVY